MLLYNCANNKGGEATCVVLLCCSRDFTVFEDKQAKSYKVHGLWCL